MKLMNYEETLERIHGFQKYGSRLGLARMAVLMELLGNPQDEMKIIHVGGTNGKGSVCRYLASMLSENGYKAGLYTSPYLEQFTERIEFDGREISKDDLVGCAAIVFEQVDRMMAMGHESPTEFELVTAIGFVYFSRLPMDFLVLEVGLGGRGDSTNIIKDPLAAVITSISLDHMEVLGDDTGKIAAEKAGIIKNGCPVISNVRDEKAFAVIRDAAREKGCEFYDAASIRYFDVEKSLDGYSFSMESAGQAAAGPKRVSLSMIGMHQVENAVCALTVIEVLAKRDIIKVNEEKTLRGIRVARQAGRLEILRREPCVIIDGAHNEAGVFALSRVVNDHFPGKKILLVAGMLADKKVDRLLAGFASIPCDMIATEPDNPRKLPGEELCRLAIDAGCRCIESFPIKEAFRFALRESRSYDLVLFSGSIYLIGRIREMFRNEVQ